MKIYNMCICYLIPIVIHLLFMPFYFLENGWIASLIEIFIGTFVIPIYLISASYRFLGDFKLGRFFLILILILLTTIFGIIIDYFNWGVSTGNLLKPDSETVHIIWLEIVISSTIIIVSWCIVALIKKWVK